MVDSIRTFPTADSPRFSFGECSRGSILSSKQVLSHSREQDDMDRVLHALADASRRVSVERPSKGPASVGELAAAPGAVAAGGDPAHPGARGEWPRPLEEGRPGANLSHGGRGAAA